MAVPAPERCTGCSGPLLRLEAAPPAQVHQVVELPRIVPEVKQYELHAGWCAGCNAWRCAALPAGVPEGIFGPRLTGFMALCTGRFRLSKRLVQELLEDVLGVQLGPDGEPGAGGTGAPVARVRADAAGRAPG